MSSEEQPTTADLAALQENQRTVQKHPTADNGFLCFNKVIDFKRFARLWNRKCQCLDVLDFLKQFRPALFS